MALDRVPLDLPPPPGGDLSPDAAIARFRKAGFLDPRSARSTWTELLEALPLGNPFRATLGETWRTMARSADPDLALRRWSRWVEADLGSRAAGEGDPRARRWAESPTFREAFLLIAGVSPALAEELERSWEAFEPEKWQAGGWETGASMEARLRPYLDLPLVREEDAFAEQLRRFRRHEELRIAYLDECRLLPVDAVTLQVSWLAAAVIAAALARARAETLRRLGLPVVPPDAPILGFTVLALGKLGSEELNYSSDIDLFFLGDEAGPGDAPVEVREQYF